MERLFPGALLACIREGRPPEPQELSALAEKIWREAISRRPCGDHRQAFNAANVALVGQHHTAPAPSPAPHR